MTKQRERRTSISFLVAAFPALAEATVLMPSKPLAKMDVLMTPRAKGVLAELPVRPVMLKLQMAHARGVAPRGEFRGGHE